MEEDQQQSKSTHAHIHFATEVADIVEARIWGRIARWLLINLGALIGAIAVGIAAYYSLESRVNNLNAVSALLMADHASIKSSLNNELRDINLRLDEINRYLRDRK